MNEILTLRSYPLDDLQDLIKPVWSSSYKWRLYEGKIEFAIQTTHGDHWFPLYKAPEKVEKFVKAWYRSGGLNNQERIDV
jgi:hypothetical protein